FPAEQSPDVRCAPCRRPPEFPAPRQASSDSGPVGWPADAVRGSSGIFLRNSQPDFAGSSGLAHPATRVLSDGLDTCALSGSIPPVPAGALHPPAGKFQRLVVLDEPCISAPTVQNG